MTREQAARELYILAYQMTVPGEDVGMVADDLKDIAKGLEELCEKESE
jgi:hypothetical protein